jgi:hypothetical protein
VHQDRHTQSPAMKVMPMVELRQSQRGRNA